MLSRLTCKLPAPEVSSPREKNRPAGEAWARLCRKRALMELFHAALSRGALMPQSGAPEDASAQQM